ncbi:MAG: AMP-binding protein, partial [Kurthia sp.]|nr:AMP-binding protein [Kurthia sp.]
AQTYGMTETASQVATLSSKDALRKVGSVGKPLMFNEICIAGAERPFDHGEICVRGDSVTPGYVGQHAHIKTQVDGFLHTGDIGYFDDEGYLYVADRRSDLIISGGENIYPAEIENVLAGHPHIAAVGVCGVQDEIWGQVPAAFIMSKETTLNAETILAFCEDKLAKYKLPKQIHFVEELPRNGTGKLLRRKLVELIPK